ncbi:MAG: CDP-alcohol phosphatidyltransferase family protein [Planctomycetes bacterium]|nr:CDP-alcohol phosphatidyltransferase family protein [Planctomycetota bacterium]
MAEPAGLDRRPIAARRLRVFQAMASWLARRGSSANQISILGMLCGLGAGFALFFTSEFPTSARWLWFAAAALVPLRLLANMLDGMVALERGVASRVGEIYNEVPDRVSDSAVLVGLGYAFGGNPAWGWAAALAAMLTAYIRATGKAAGARNEFCGPMAKQQRMAIVIVTAAWCGATPWTWQTFTAGKYRFDVPEAALILITAGSLFTAARRLARIAAALRNPA